MLELALLPAGANAQNAYIWNSGDGDHLGNRHND
jgi:hypothetical protein